MFSLVGLTFEKLLKNPELYNEFKRITGEIDLDGIMIKYVKYLKTKRCDCGNDVILLDKYPEIYKAYWILYHKCNYNELIELILTQKLYNWARFLKKNRIITSYSTYQKICILLSEDRIENLVPTLDISSIENFKLSCFLGLKRISRFLYRRMVSFEQFKFKCANPSKALLEGKECYIKGNPKKDVMDFWEFLGSNNPTLKDFLT